MGVGVAVETGVGVGGTGVGVGVGVAVGKTVGVGVGGTGVGVGAAWMITNLGPGQRFVSVESDPIRFSAVSASALNKEARVSFIQGDWRLILDHKPFQLLFVDGGGLKGSLPEEIVESVAVGGLLLMDDLTPPELWSDPAAAEADPARTAWLEHPRLLATELRVRQDHSVMLAAKV